jgi:hypothetical protein
VYGAALEDWGLVERILAPGVDGRLQDHIHYQKWVENWGFIFSYDEILLMI